MTRFAAILLMLKFAAPQWGPKVETAYELEQLELRYRVRAELVIADVEHESRWRDDVINPLSGTTGLMQVDPLSTYSCGATRERWSEECWARRSLLTDWRANLRIGVAIFAASRDYCRKRGLGVYERDWLWLPTGWDSVSGSRCGHSRGRRLPTPKGIAWLLRRAASLRHVGR